MMRQSNRCSPAAITITQATNRPIIRLPPFTLWMSNSDATITEKMRMKNIPNSKVFGNSLTFLKNEAMIDSVVMVNITTNSLSVPVSSNARPAPMIRNKRLSPRPANIPPTFCFCNMPW